MDISNKSFFITIALFSLFLNISGCVSNPRKPEVEVKVETKSNIFKYIATNESGNKIDADVIAHILAEQLPSLSKYGPFATYDRSYQGWSSTRGNYGLMAYKQRGVTAKARGDQVLLQYLDGQKGANSSYTTVFSKTTISLKVETIKRGELIEVQVIPSSSIVNNMSKSIFVRWGALDSNENIAKDVTNILGKINPKIPANLTTKGEINIEYSDSSVYGNFERILGSYEGGNVKKYDLEKEKVFNLKVGEDTNPVYISIYPYRNGSKVVYYFNTPYYLLPDGTSTIDYNLITSLEKRIESVAKD